jgi:hypothetical protein
MLSPPSTHGRSEANGAIEAGAGRITSIAPSKAIFSGMNAIPEVFILISPDQSMAGRAG